MCEPRRTTESNDAAGSQHWTLNTIGNWNSFDTDLNNDGAYSSTNDRIHAGGFSDANEITQIQRTISGGSPTTLSFTYDKAGNLREQQLSASVKMRYTHDAWNRLVNGVRALVTAVRSE